MEMRDRLKRSCGERFVQGGVLHSALDCCEAGSERLVHHRVGSAGRRCHLELSTEEVVDDSGGIADRTGDQYRVRRVVIELVEREQALCVIQRRDVTIVVGNVNALCLKVLIEDG